MINGHNKITILFCLFINTLTGQDITIKQSKEIFTPFGKAPQSNVHYVRNTQFINITDQVIQIVDKKSGKIIREFENDFKSKKEDQDTRKKMKMQKVSAPITEGWITYASTNIYGYNPPPISLFNASWIVPLPPIRNSYQMIYIFNSLSTTKSGMSYIIQPVLQWGVSPVGGGDYWSICNWFVTSTKHYLYDSLISVNPGTELQGVIKLISFSDTLYNYNSSFTGYLSGLQVNNLPLLQSADVALESYRAETCDEYPIDEKIRMYDIDIIAENKYPNLKWIAQNQETNCGQHTKVINGSSKDGEIDIYFRTPYCVDNCDVIHFYPNPVNDMLHVSPARPINDLKITVYDYMGKPVLSLQYKNLNYEINIDFQDYLKGIYLIAFWADNKKYSFKIVKI